MFVLIALGLLSLRLLFLAVTNLPLDCEEAQYWVWSKQFAWGYFSKPPLTSWMMALTTHMGQDTAFWVRVSAPLFHTGTGCVLYHWGKEVFGKEKATYAGLIYLTLPGTFFSSILMTTDVPMLFFSALASFFLWKAVQNNKLQSWMSAGLFLGLALLSKYIAIFVAVSFVLFLWARSRNTFSTRGFWMMLGLAMLILLPNILWQFENGLPTVHHTAHSNIVIQAYGKNFHWNKALDYIGGQYALFGPLIFLAFFKRKMWRATDRHTAFFHFFTWPIFVGMIFQALMAKINLNWGVLMCLGVVLLIVRSCSVRSLKWIIGTNLFFGLLLLAVLTDYKAASKWVGIHYKGHAYHQTLEALEHLKAENVKASSCHLIVGHRCLAALGSFYGSFSSAGKWFLEGRPHDYFDQTSPYRQEKQRDGTFLIYTGHEADVFSPHFKTLHRVGTLKKAPVFVAKDFIKTETP